MPNVFRDVFMPYAIMKLSDGRHIVVNRNQEPIGLNTGEFVDYDDYAVRFKNLPPAKAARISCYGFADPDDIQLWDDGCNPFTNARHMKDYLHRYAMLLELKIIPEDDYQRAHPKDPRIA